MSLVPILYTSLILFSILMVVIISFSYIAYKVRNRNNEDEEQAASTTYLRTKTSYIPERRSYQPQAIKVVPAIKNPDLKKTYLPNNTTERTTVVNERSTSERYNRETTKTQGLSKTREPQTTEFQDRRTNSGSFKSRLEILNRVAPEESKREKFTVNGSGSIAIPKYYENFRAIQYYSDDEEEYLYKPSRQYH